MNEDNEVSSTPSVSIKKKTGRLKDKVSYSCKKDAVSKMNWLKNNITNSRMPCRIYCEDDRWYLTSVSEFIAISPSEILELYFKYTFKFGEDKDKVIAKKLKAKLDTIL